MKVQTLRVPGRAWTLNVERAAHWRAHRERTDAWRQLATLTALGRVPGSSAMEPVLWATVSANIMQCLPLADTGNAYPAVKAIVDGLVDCGVLYEDTGEYVRAITLHAPHPVAHAHQECVVLQLAGPLRPSGRRWRRWA